MPQPKYSINLKSQTTGTVRNSSHPMRIYMYASTYIWFSHLHALLQRTLESDCVWGFHFCSVSGSLCEDMLRPGPQDKQQHWVTSGHWLSTPGEGKTATTFCLDSLAHLGVLWTGFALHKQLAEFHGCSYLRLPRVPAIHSIILYCRRSFLSLRRHTGAQAWAPSVC